MAHQNNEELLALHNQLSSLFDDVDFEYLKKEIPLAFDQTSDGVRRVSDIVLAMKSFAHNGNSELGPVKIDDLINSTVEISRNAWKYVADLTVEHASPPLKIKGMWGELGQVLLNLIVNAAYAIEASNFSESNLGEIHIQTRRTDDWGEIIVSDNGCGIEPSMLDKIFEPFFTTKDVGEGSGQGLAMAYNIITEGHAGELLVESKPGKGSSFTIRLPLHTD
jgi:signal transduction histidine kinase